MSQAPSVKSDLLFIAGCQYHPREPDPPPHLSEHEIDVVNAWGVDDVIVYQAVSTIVALAVRGSSSQLTDVMDKAWNLVRANWHQQLPVYTCLEIRRLLRAEGLEPPS